MTKHIVAYLQVGRIGRTKVLRYILTIAAFIAFDKR
jgi:hypothetical protein